MFSGRSWHDRRNKPQIKLNIKEIEWVSLMNECLMGPESLRNGENENEKCLDPKLVMDVRHNMVKESAKIVGLAPIETHTEALRLLRIKNREKMLKQKEEKLVEKEIAKLKQTLENNRLLVRKKLEEATEIKRKSSASLPKFVGCYAKMWRRFEFQSGAYEVDTWLGHSVQMSMETKINRQGVPFDVKVSVKRQSQGEESFKPVNALEQSTISNEAECAKLLKTDEGKDEIINTFNEKNTKSVKEESQINYNKRDENFRKILEIKNRTNRRILKCAWLTWKDYARQLKNRKREKRNYSSKIEAFLSKLQERGRKEVKTHTSGKKEIRIGKPKNRKNQITNEEKAKRLKNLMEEVKTSQKEVFQKLQEISKNNDVKNEGTYSNLNFLKRMEKRREERLKRWKEIQEKKLKLEEDKKNAQKLKEEEKKQKEEENKRKKLEELKEKRRLDKEKKEERDRERERLRLSTNLAENHYRKYLLRSFGLRPWFTMMKIRESQLEKAMEFFERTLTRKAFHRLTSNVQEEMRLKTARALEFHERMLKKNILLLWLEFHKENMRQNQVAADWNEFKITERFFKTWMLFTQNEQLEYLNKKHIAQLNYERNLKTKYFKKLHDYPNLKKLEEAKENRKRKWRQRVKEILPDYQPPEISKDFYSLLV